MAIRERKEELPLQLAFAANQDVVLGGIGIPRDLPLSYMLLVLEGRLLISGQTVAGTYFPEAPQSLIRRIRVRGTKVSGGGSVTLVDIRGEEAHFMTRAYQQFVPLGSTLSDVAGSGGTPFPNFPAPTANGSFDFRTAFLVPFAPPLSIVADEIEGILDPSIFSQLDLIVSFGDSTFLVNGQTATVTLQGFAGGATPLVFVTRFAPLAEGLPIMRYHYTYLSKYVQSGLILAASGSNQKIMDINVGNRLRAIFLRQYSEQAGQVGLIAFTGSGAAAVSSGRIGDNSNAGTFRWYTRLNGANKFQMRQPDLRELNRKQFNHVRDLLPQGYSVIEWGDRGFVNDTIFDTRGYGATATRFELFGDTLNLAATDRLDALMVEQIPVEV